MHICITIRDDHSFANRQIDRSIDAHRSRGRNRNIQSTSFLTTFEENVEILRQNKSLITPLFSLSKSGVEVNILKLTFSSAAGIFFETFDKSNQSDKDYFPFREISRGYPVTDV